MDILLFLYIDAMVGAHVLVLMGVKDYQNFFINEDFIPKH